MENRIFSLIEIDDGKGWAGNIDLWIDPKAFGNTLNEGSFP